MPSWVYQPGQERHTVVGIRTTHHEGHGVSPRSIPQLAALDEVVNRPIDLCEEDMLADISESTPSIAKNQASVTTYVFRGQRNIPHHRIFRPGPSTGYLCRKESGRAYAYHRTGTKRRAFPRAGRSSWILTSETSMSF